MVADVVTDKYIEEAKKVKKNKQFFSQKCWLLLWTLVSI